MNSVLKPKVSSVQLVTPAQFKRQDASVMRGAQVQQKTKDGLTEVRDIFGRVEHAFKKRKEETKILEMEVHDLEKHLDYLENQTQDQIRETAALNLAYVNSKAGISSAEHEICLTNDSELAVCKELSADLERSVGSVRTLSDNSDADMCVLDAALESIRDAATQLLSDMESDLDEAARREVCIGEIHEELAAIKQLIEEDEAILKTEHSLIEQITNAIAERSTTLAAIGDRRAALEREIAAQSARKHALLTQQDVLAAARRAAQEHHAAWHVTYEAECQQKDAEIAALKEEFANLQAARLATEQLLRTQKQQDTATEAAIGDKKASLQQKSQALEHARAELATLESETSQLQQAVERTRAELAESKHSMALAAKNNEDQYGLACCRMAQLREVHQEDAAVTLALNAAKDALSAKVRDLDTAVAAVQTSLEQQRLTVEQRRNEVGQGSKSLDEIRVQVTAQRASNEAIQQSRQSLLDEIHRLEHFVVELQWEVDERSKKTALVREAEANYAAVEQQNEHDRELARTTDEQIASLDQSIAEVTATLKKKPAIAAITAEQEALLNVEVEREMQEQYREKDIQLAADVAQIKSCREQLAGKLPVIEAQHAQKLEYKRAEVVQALADLTAAEAAAAAARAQAQAQEQARQEEQRRAAERQAQADAKAEAAQLAAEKARALAQAQAEALAQAQAKAAEEAQARERQEQEAAAQRQAQAEREAQDRAMPTAEAKSRTKAERKSKKHPPPPQEPSQGTAPQIKTSELPLRRHTPSRHAEELEQAEVHDDLVMAGADSLFTEHGDSHSGGGQRVLSRKYSSTHQRMTPSGSSISSHMLFEDEYSMRISTAAAVAHTSKLKCSSPVHTFAVPYGHENTSNHQHHKTPSNLSQWELSEPATKSKLPPLPPLGERRTQAPKVTSTATATQAGDIAQVSHSQRAVAQQAVSAPTSEAAIPPEPEDSASASTSASSAERKKAKHKRHKEKQKLRKKLQASSAMSVVSDSSLNLLQPYPTTSRPSAPPLAAVLKASATAPPRAVPGHVPVTAKPAAEHVVPAKSLTAHADRYRQFQSSAAVPSTKHSSALPQQYKEPESVLRRNATVTVSTAVFPQKTYHKKHKPIASTDWFSEDAPF